MSDRMPDLENSYVPSSYEDLYTYYIVGRTGNSLCKSLLRQKLPYTDESERESLLHDVFLRIMEHRMLERFDPAQSNFGGVIFFVTRTVIVNHLDRRTRNPLSGLKGGTIDFSGPGEDFEPGVIKLDKVFSTSPAVSENAMDRDRRLQRIFDYARERFNKKESVRDTNLLTLLKLLLEEHEPKECAIPLGVTPSTIYNWIAHLRLVAAEMD